ncbi:hypothetical protein Hanom_Chr14g01252731 [Helianthus anomalus]
MELPKTRGEMLEELGLDDGNFKFDIEDEIPSSPDKEYDFKYAHEADNFNDVIVEAGSDTSEEDTPFHYSGVDDTFPTLAEMLRNKTKTTYEGKWLKRQTTEGIPQTVPQETLLEGKKNWFKVMPKERKFRRPLQYFTHNADISLGDILSWGYLEDLQINNIKKFYHGLDVKQHDQRLWKYIKWHAKNRFPDWMPQYPKQDIKIDHVTKEKDITLIIKPPRCLMPLHAMEQDFYEDFQGWMYNQGTTEAVISLFD